MINTYVVCQTPNCQQTYPIEDVVKTYEKNNKVGVFCGLCNGILVDDEGRSNLSGDSKAITVVGDTLVNTLYKEDQLYSIKVVTHNGILTHYKSEDIQLFINRLKNGLLSKPVKIRGKVRLVEKSVDGTMINSNLIQLLIKNGVSISKKGYLSLKNVDKNK